MFARRTRAMQGARERGLCIARAAVMVKTPRRGLSEGHVTMMPDTIRFLLIIGGLIGVVYGSAWLLAHMPPRTVETTKELSDAPLRGLQ